jgi:hypothetical protein
MGQKAFLYLKPLYQIDQNCYSQQFTRLIGTNSTPFTWHAPMTCPDFILTKMVLEYKIYFPIIRNRETILFVHRSDYDLFIL